MNTFQIVFSAWLLSGLASLLFNTYWRKDTDRPDATALYCLGIVALGPFEMLAFLLRRRSFKRWKFHFRLGFIGNELPRVGTSTLVLPEGNYFDVRHHGGTALAVDGDGETYLVYEGLVTAHSEEEAWELIEHFFLVQERRFTRIAEGSDFDLYGAPTEPCSVFSQN